MDTTDSVVAIWSRLQVVYGHLSGEINRALYRETGLSEADAAILIALLQTPESQLHSFELRCGLAWEKSRLSHQLRRMETRGLIERAACAEDGRSSVIRMTAEGRALAATARQVLGTAIRRSLQGALAEDQIEQLDVMTAMVVARLEPVEGRAHPGPGTGQ